MKVVYFDCCSGISAKRIFGAIIDLGIDLKSIKNHLKDFSFKDYRIHGKKYKENSVEGTQVNIEIFKHINYGISYKEINNLIESSKLKDSVKKKTTRIIKKYALAQAEAYGTKISKIDLSKVISFESIINVVGSILALELLQIDVIYSSPIIIGEGALVKNGRAVPVTSPITFKLMAGLPCSSIEIQKDLTDSIGVALIATLAKDFISMPKMKILNTGYGVEANINGKNINVLPVVLGEMDKSRPQQNMIMIETNIDDMNSEFYEHIMESLFKVGAVDVFLSPIMMKKNRPATKISLIISKEKQEAASSILFNETSTFGLRSYEISRDVLSRYNISIKTSFGKVCVKIGKLGEKIVQVSPEYDECRKLAKKTKVPLKDIYEEVLQIAKKKLNVNKY